MDLLNTIGSALGGKDADQGNDLMQTILNLIGGQSGLAGLAEQFTSKGLGDVISSWIGTGNNLPVSASQLQNVLGSDVIGGIASKLGINSEAVTGQLSNLLPQVVDKLTPEGRIPEGDILSQGMDLLGGLFSKK